MKIKLIVWLAVVGALSGCALSPQQINLKPSINVAAASYGNQQDIRVRVEDHRASPVIGTRGGIYAETSTIEVGNDYKSEIGFAVANALTRWQFHPHLDGNDQGAPQFVVGIEKISYQPDSNPAIGKMHISVTLTATVENGNRRYQGSYTANGDLAYVTVPTSSKNEQRINEIFSLALQKVFNDKGLIDFLR